MVKTFEEGQEERAEEKGESEGKYPYYFEDGAMFRGSSLVERFHDIKDILMPFPGRRPDVGEEAPDTGIGVPGIDIDLDTASTEELLAILIEVQLASIERLNRISSNTQMPSTVTVSGVEVIDNADDATAVIPQSVFTRKLFIRADPLNTDDIYFGDDQVQPQDGFMLRPGELTVIPINYEDEALFMASATENQLIQLLGVA